MSTNTHDEAASKQPRKQRAAALARASLGLYDGDGALTLPEGLEREGHDLVMRVRRDVVVHGKTVSLHAEGRLGHKQLGNTLLEEHEREGVEGPERALVEKGMARAAADLVAQLDGQLETMVSAIEAPLKAVIDAAEQAASQKAGGAEQAASQKAGAAEQAASQKAGAAEQGASQKAGEAEQASSGEAGSGEQAAGGEAVLSEGERAARRAAEHLPKRLTYEQLKPRLAPFLRECEVYLRKAALRRVARLAREGALSSGCEGARERGDGVELLLRRDMVLPLGDGVPLSVVVPFPVGDELAHELSYIPDDGTVRNRLRQLISRFDKVYRAESQAGLRYAAAVLTEAGVGEADPSLVRPAIEEALTRLDDVKLHLRRAAQKLSARMREQRYRADIEALERYRDRYADVGAYYPLARSMNRKVVLFVGPTNSGKTYRALNLLAEQERGAYLAPLRLLALEGQAELETRGKPCTFMTGEERDIRKGATFVSSTIEMLDFTKPLDAVLIDEIQLLGDPGRGWAWTAALVGAPARTVILTGSPSCREAVERICQMLGEELEVVECERLSPLEVMRRPVALSRLTKGTAVVAFSRRDVLDLKATIEQTAGLRCSVIYGNLSPRVRREEARRFREGETDVLVSTDAIAMGLNLPLERVVFFTTVKYDGQQERRLSDHEILQIGGRAGRYGKASKGEVSALTRDSLRDVELAFSRHPRPTRPPFRIMPDERHVELLAEALETDSLERILTFFGRSVRFSSEMFMPADLTDLTTLAAIVDRQLPEVDLATRLLLASAPVEVDDEKLRGAWQRMLVAYARGDEAKLDDLFSVGRWERKAKTDDPFELLEAETQLKALTIYAWLAYRFGTRFRRLEECEASRDSLSTFIEASLRGRTVRRCVACGEHLPLGFRFSRCDRCHFGHRGEREDDGRAEDSLERDGEGRAEGGYERPRLGRRV